ncbi:MAG: putative sortase [Candidatus Saccharibacteria bacterium]|nr:putative sortase [Candidatus Saccharibacteria bacterium]
MAPDDKKSSTDPTNRDAATNVVRDQLNALYTGQSATSTAGSTTAAQQSSQASNDNDPTANHMRQYHSQWQDYYQKYYERYYVGHLHQAINEQQKSLLTPEQQREEEIVELRQKIVGTAKESAKKARKSRHFLPIASAFAVVFVVAFLQYNEILFANVQAYVSPGAIDPQNIVVDPTANVQVSADPKLIIPKINVNVPVIYNVAIDHDAQMAAMQKGVAHFAIPGADSVPGQVGNTTFSGHSSNDLFDPGDYKFIFAQLDKLQQGDTIYVNYNSIRYTYTVTKKEVVKPTQVDKLTYTTDKPILTLITCTPLGTSTNRLLVTAEQVSPDPAKATAANAAGSSGNAALPGNGATALEKLFGAR